jgi:predicted P-loop ATPase
MCTKRARRWILERDEMDSKMKRERASVDLAIKQKRENMFRTFKQIHEDMDMKVLREREHMMKL